MYLFSRRARLAGGNTNEAMAWATGITEQVNKITGIGLSLYQLVYSPGFGTLVWSSFHQDLATLEAVGDKLQSDEKFAAMADKGAKFTIGGLDDSLSQVLAGDPDPTRQIEYVNVVQSACASGKLNRGIELGIDIAQRAEKVTNTPTLFLLGSTGTYGAVSWATAHATVKAMEAAQAALQADTSFGEYVDREASVAYTDNPAMTTQLIYRRIA